MPGLVPELAVSDWRRSRAFYCDLLGFTCCYDRPEEGFAYLVLGDAHLMIDQIGLGRTFDETHRPQNGPCGWGVNLQIAVERTEPLLSALTGAGWPLFLPLEEKWYRVGQGEVGNRQFVVADPDGYLLRFYQDLGERLAT
ncbi:MAG: VOC family protein [Tabrizicola sp.]|jgi:catechol 2,3-dioxygenase-like lactoylglutathione lyase family enzyme|nr:VOC family protein [Tabrizicola sp.]